MAINYLYAKRSIPDWTTYCSEQLKSELKILIFKEYLNSHDAEKVMKKATKEINLFIAFINDREVAKRFNASLNEYCQELLAQCQKGIGTMSAGQMAMALSNTLTEAQKRILNNVAKNSGTITIQGSNQAAVLTEAIKEKGETVPDYAYNRATAAQTYYKDVQKQIKEFLNTYKSTDKPKGTIFNSVERNYAEMNIRFEAYKANKKALIDKGVKIVLVPAHSNCSKRCQQYQGKLYSLDGTSGSVDGRNYVPIEDVSDKVTYTSPSTGKTYYAGLFSYNCRHSLEPYTSGMNIEDIPDEVIERQRNLEEMQRQMERKYRKGREEYFIQKAIYDKTKSADARAEMNSLFKQNALLRKQYESFCFKNNIPSYRDRLLVISSNGADEIGGNVDNTINDVPSINTEIAHENIAPVLPMSAKEHFDELGKDYVDVKTYEEANKYFMNEFGMAYSKVDLSRLDIRNVNKTLSVLHKVKKAYGSNVKFDLYSASSTMPRGHTSAEAAYAFGSRELYINGTIYKDKASEKAHKNKIDKIHKSNIDNIDMLIEYKKLNPQAVNASMLTLEAYKESGRSNVGLEEGKELNLETSIIHEMGHCLDDILFKLSNSKHYGYLDNKQYGLIDEHPGFDISESMKTYGKKISAYAVSKKEEYIAESFASWWTEGGDKIDPYLKKVFEDKAQWMKK